MTYTFVLKKELQNLSSCHLVCLVSISIGIVSFEFLSELHESSMVV